jgi:uncharacterized lipoprotein YddW (UPF0748 family)
MPVVRARRSPTADTDTTLQPMITAAPRAMKLLALPLTVAAVLGTACLPRGAAYPEGVAPTHETAGLGADEAHALRHEGGNADATPHQAAHDLMPPPVTGVGLPGPAYIAAAEDITLPTVPREFRGVWVATVANMDWPSRRDLTTAQAQAELIRILDAARDNGLNAVIFQVRPMADAFYESAIEPWSDYLTGASDRAPNPYWDPLAFAIEQAHARGMELHAWFNPFRAGFVAKRTPLAANHVSQRRPDLVRRYGTFYWLDPGEPDARQLAVDVITDVVRRYDVDAVHIDDYFYPYQQRDARGRLIAFPDDATWREYGMPTGLSRNDWRRSNIDSFVEQLYAAVRAENRYVRVGISPFGIWRPGHPASVRGLDSFSDLYADTRKWLMNGWADYYAPQLYWRTHAPQQDYRALLQWWAEQNPFGRHIWAGNIPNSIGDGPRGWPASEIVEQVQLTRASGTATGNVHFSAASLLRNPGGLFDALRASLYTESALVPASPWLSGRRLPAPSVSAMPDPGLHATALSFEPAGERPASWIVHARWGDAWQTLLLPGRSRQVSIDWRDGTAPDAVALAAVDRAGVEGEPAVLLLRH